VTDNGRRKSGPCGPPTLWNETRLVASFSFSLDDVTFLGSDLRRPECVLATARGHLFCADARGGVVVLDPDGGEHYRGARTPEGEAPRFRPNGVALLPDGGLLFANLGAEGGIWRIDPATGETAPFLMEVEGRPLLGANFVVLDDRGRLWITVSTTPDHRHDFSRTRADGFVVLCDDAGARVVGDGFIWTNECRPDPAGEWLYVNETFGKRLSRLRIAADGSLGQRETVATFGSGTFPDGLAFDAEGGVWVISVVSNRLIRIGPDGEARILLEDCEPDHVAAVEAALDDGRLTPALVYDNRARRLPNISSLAFGGPDLRTLYLGNISGGPIAVLRESRWRGAPPPHWAW